MGVSDGIFRTLQQAPNISSKEPALNLSQVMSYRHLIGVEKT